MKYKWTLEDNRRVFQGYISNESPESISSATGIPFKSIKMKLSNFRYIMTGKGLANCSLDSIRVAEEYIKRNIK